MLLILLACSEKTPGTTPDPWPEPEEGPGALVYTEATEAWGLGAVNGAQLQAVDLDGDGYADLVVNDNSGIDDFEASAGGTGGRYHWTLMNRPDGAGGRVFLDETEASGLFARREGAGGRPSVDHIFADVNGDGFIDAFAGVFNDPHTDPAVHYTDTSEVLLNDGDGHFTFAPASPDLQVDFPMSGVTFTDYDGDGVVDLFIALWYANADIYGNGSWLNWLYGANDRLLRGNGDGTFTDVTAAAGLELNEATNDRALDKVLDGSHARPSMGATACDLDGDTLPELLVMAYGRQWNLQWQNQGDGTFVEVGGASGYAGDDDIDYTDNWYYQCTCWVDGSCDAPTDPDFPYSERQCEQVAGGGYWNPGWDDQPANLNGNTFNTACADVDNDGDLDLWSGEITHQWAGGSSDLSGLLLNEGDGTFTRPDLDTLGLLRTPVPDPSTRSWDYGDQKSAVADLDLDGRKDLLLPSGAAYFGNVLYAWRQWDDLRFTEIEADVGLAVPTAHGVALADFDRDGDLDLVAASLSEVLEGTTSDHRLYFYENGLAERHFLRVRLDTWDSNSVGVGSRVTVTAGGRTQTQEVSGGYGQHGMQMEPVLTFGLGLGAEVESVEVTWPGGDTDRCTDVPADTQVLIAPGCAMSEEPPR
ncbi:MAG: CRTAC1 family protein [Pseudomonadota bacterium]|nr:CRTAC1 family protein [Pseudomonadota bacterium]